MVKVAGPLPVCLNSAVTEQQEKKQGTTGYYYLTRLAAGAMMPGGWCRMNCPCIWPLADKTATFAGHRKPQ